MAHINAIGASMYSDLAVCLDPAVLSAVKPKIAAGTAVYADFAGGFAAADFTANTALRITNVREFPSMGTPPNVVKVPVFGSATSQQIQGQADAPSMELTMNYIPADWADGTPLGNLVGDGHQYIFRFALMNSKPEGAEGYASSATGLGAVQNSQYFWVGKIEALQVSPQLTDANKATLTITIQSDFFGAYTV
jgi:hypothetical protein